MAPQYNQYPNSYHSSNQSNTNPSRSSYSNSFTNSTRQNASDSTTHNVSSTGGFSGYRYQPAQSSIAQPSSYYSNNQALPATQYAPATSYHNEPTRATTNTSSYTSNNAPASGTSTYRLPAQATPSNASTTKNWSYNTNNSTTENGRSRQTPIDYGSYGSTSTPQPVQPQASYAPLQQQTGYSNSQSRSYGSSAYSAPRVNEQSRSVEAQRSPSVQEIQPPTTSQWKQNILANTSSKRDSGLTQAAAPESQAPLTVDPAQVYDSYHETKRTPAQPIRQPEAAPAEPVIQEPVSTMPEPSSTHLAAVGTAEQTPKPKKPRKSRAKPKPSTNADDTAAAMTLMQTANSGAPPGINLEAQMREMFQKMREFNQKDPDMLARLWQQERDAHLANEAGDSSKKAAAPAAESTETPSKKTKAKSKPKPKAKTNATDLSPESTTKKPPHSSSTPVTAALQPPPQSPLAASSNSKIVAPAPTTPVAKPSSGTVWPSEKKATLAAAAAQILSEAPDTRSAGITAENISSMLDKNPSYIELCQAIEKHGIKLNRSQFAKKLVAAVPDVNKKTASSTASTSTPSAAASSSGSHAPRPAANTPKPGSLAEAEKRLMSGENILESPKKKKTPRSRTSPNSKSKATPSQPTKDGLSNDHPIDLEGLAAVQQFNKEDSTPVSQAGESQTKTKKGGKSANRKSSIAASIQTPQTKEDLARKRKFSDLVDLSLLTDSDEEEAIFPPAKRVDTGDESAAKDAAGESVDAMETAMPTPPQTDMESAAPIPPSIKGPRLMDNTMQSSSDLQKITNPTSSSASVPVQPTIRHQPTTNGAGASQAQTQPPLEQAIPSVQTPSMPDRALPPPSQAFGAHFSAPTIGPGHPTAYVQICTTLDRSKALRRDHYDSRTIARDVLLACGRHPDMRPLNKHLELFKTTFSSVDNDSDLSTIRWDVIDPGGPPVGSGPLETEDYNDGAEADDEGDDDDGDSVLGTADAIRHNQAAGPSLAVAPAIVLPPPRRVGRPPKASIAPPFGTLANFTPVRQAAPTQQPSTVPTLPTTYSELRAAQLSRSGEAPRRGRPVGWRKWMQKDTGGAATPSKPPSKPSTKADPPPPAPIYQVYRCEWHRCGAELHNLAKLRTHIQKLHARETDKGWVCAWNGCGRTESAVDPASGRVRQSYEHIAFPAHRRWLDHVQLQHLQPIAWRLGDGPADGVSDHYDTDAGSEAYLSDRQGRRVTPVVQFGDAAAAAAAPASKKRRTAEEKAREELAAAEQRRRAIGAGVDVAGAPLVNDKRRLGFVDDDEQPTIVSDDD